MTTTASVEFSVDVPPASAVTARHFASGVTDAPLLVLAHGAGADQRHRFLVDMARRLTARSIEVVTFNFLYTEQRRRTPDRSAVLERTWRAVLDGVVRRLQPRGRVAVGGKSMGGRIASQVLADRPDTPGWQRVSGLVLLGYPLHPPGQPDRTRAAHLPSIGVPILVVQGTRDAFGTRSEVEPVFGALPVPVAWAFVEGGDHGFAVPKSTGRTESDVLDEVAERVAAWLHYP